MSLLSYIDKNKLRLQEAESLYLKNQEVIELTKKLISQGLTVEQAKADAESQIFTPKPLPRINLASNKTQGKRIKIFFFVTEEEYNQISNKFKILQQFDEERIASSCIQEFVDKILK